MRSHAAAAPGSRLLSVGRAHARHTVGARLPISGHAATASGALQPMGTGCAAARSHTGDLQHGRAERAGGLVCSVGAHAGGGARGADGNAVGANRSVARSTAEPAARFRRHSSVGGGHRRLLASAVRAAAARSEPTGDTRPPRRVDLGSEGAIESDCGAVCTRIRACLAAPSHVRVGGVRGSHGADADGTRAWLAQGSRAWAAPLAPAVCSESAGARGGWSPQRKQPMAALRAAPPSICIPDAAQVTPHGTVAGDEAK
mmetsp:Transcript_73566/g.163484  ORF Transcript_73566/g.163484 Transcript_73566/m.163484 type:complete len:258 (+) Transcript_73566:520-1293(+)